MRPTTDLQRRVAPFKVQADFAPAGDQPAAIDELERRITDGESDVVVLGATGTGVTGIFGILLHLHMPLQYLIMMAISFGVSFAVTWVIWTPEAEEAKA